MGLCRYGGGLDFAILGGGCEILKFFFFILLKHTFFFFFFFFLHFQECKPNTVK